MLLLLDEYSCFLVTNLWEHTRWVWLLGGKCDCKEVWKCRASTLHRREVRCPQRGCPQRGTLLFMNPPCTPLFVLFRTQYLLSQLNFLLLHAISVIPYSRLSFTVFYSLPYKPPTSTYHFVFNFISKTHFILFINGYNRYIVSFLKILKFVY